jgi:hypothetical protein
MTTLTAPAPPTTDAQPRHVPWRGMVWVTWRQHRVAIVGVAALLGALAAYLWHAGLQIHHAYATVTACQPTNSTACANALGGFRSKYDHTALLVPALVQALPALIGAFVGAPILARELETGTFRYAWTQSLERWRWTLAKLVLLAVAVVAIAGAFSLLFAWYDQPFIADHQTNRLSGIVFNLHGTAFATWTLTAFAIGALTGILIRRVLPAVVATLAAYTALAVAVAVVLRPRYLSPRTTSKLHTPADALITKTWATKAGRTAFTGRAPNQLLQQLCPPSAKPEKSPTYIAHCLAGHGYTLWTSYQPTSRYWPLQLIESSWLLALSALLLALIIWIVRRRAT